MSEKKITRREFVSWLFLSWVLFFSCLGAVVTMLIRYLFPNVLFEPVQTFKAGFPSEYAVDEVSLRWKDKHGVWIIRNKKGLYALSSVCTHLGCTPNWIAVEKKFKCPCHGSGFRVSGIHFEGPAPRPLERFKIALADDGRILVDKTIKYQQEKGEWNDAGAFLFA